MKASLNEFPFSGVDPVMVLHFLAQFVEEANKLIISEAQPLIALPYFLAGDAAI